MAQLSSPTPTKFRPGLNPPMKSAVARLNPTHAEPKEAKTLRRKTMKRVLLRNLCLSARTRLLSPPCYNPGPRSQFAPLAASTRPRLRFYSTESPSHNQEEDVSNEELKMQIDKYFRGDEEAIPSIFEAILKRKLTGKHEEDDKKLMEEIPGKRQEEPLSDIDDEQETKSDFDEGSDSDG